jgi:hypothetical protein
MSKIIRGKKTITLKDKNLLLKEALKNNELAIILNPSRAMSYFKK